MLTVTVHPGAKSISIQILLHGILMATYPTVITHTFKFYRFIVVIAASYTHLLSHHHVVSPPDSVLEENVTPKVAEVDKQIYSFL